MTLPPPPYAGPWDATLLRMVDADTFDCRVELPLHTDRRERFRLLNVSAPEHSTVEGKASEAWVAERLKPGAPLKLQTSYSKSGERTTLGRYLADVYYHDGTDWVSLGLAEVVSGHARVGAFEG
jgi:endonuclease YncB( thermonuclease family)